MKKNSNRFLLSLVELKELFSLKYGKSGQLGWSPRIRQKFGYFNPDDWYEALLNKLITKPTEWLDVGSGRFLFPSNDRLGKELSSRCHCLTGVDCDITLLENSYVHEKVRVNFYDFKSDKKFNLITFRMVAEHISDPDKTLRTLKEISCSGSLIVIYTINKWSPVSLITYSTPFWLHHPLKKILWGTEEKDTFPVQYKMNTRKDLQNLFETNGFKEVHFQYLDDCRTFAGFRLLLYAELLLWKCLAALKIRYPENCLLGVYEKL